MCPKYVALNILMPGKQWVLFLTIPVNQISILHIIVWQSQWWKCCLLFQEFRSEDVSDLYLEEREQQLTAAQEEKRKVQLSVPGMVNPHDMPEEMQD